MDPFCLVLTVHNGGSDIKVWGTLSGHSLGPLLLTEHNLNTKACMSIVAPYVHPLMTTVYNLLMTC